jgi:hypothetical protein
MSIRKVVPHKVQLVDVICTPADVINSLIIKEKISFHKLHRRLSMSEGNITSDPIYDDSRITELTDEKKEFKPICRERNLMGKKIKINGTLEIEIIG